MSKMEMRKVETRDESTIEYALPSRKEKRLKQLEKGQLNRQDI
jgi:hypothetical protein